MSETEMGVAFDANQTLMAMVEVAASLGHRLPWANALDAWPLPGHSGADRLRWAVEDMTRAGFIEATPGGLQPGVYCRQHPAAPAPAGDSGGGS